jgi:hypothetical protein
VIDAGMLTVDEQLLLRLHRGQVVCRVESFVTVNT